MDRNVIKTLDKITSNPNLFFSRNSLENIANLASSIDIHLLFVGKSGIGKLANIFYLLEKNPFCNQYKYQIGHQLFKQYDNKPSRSDELLLDKILFYDNIYLFDFAIISNNELLQYFDFIRKINTTYNLDGRKKIIIGRHIDVLPIIYQKQLGEEMEKSIALFWLTSSNYSNINMKRCGTSALIRISVLSKDEFLNISYWKLGSIYRKKWGEMVNSFYTIYENNNHNMAYTMAQIKWNLIEIKNGNIKEVDVIPIQNKVILPLISSLAKLSSINKIDNIKNHLNGLLALNLNPNMIIKICLECYLNNTKLKNSKKNRMIELASNSSREIAKSGKHQVILERFFYQIIEIYFT